MTTNELLKNAKSLRTVAARLSTAQKNAALLSMADQIEADEAEILSANAQDVEAARGSISRVMIDRLSLNERRIHEMAQGLRDVARLSDPVGHVIERIQRPNGLKIDRVSVPFGVVAIIYESRPNVTADAAALTLKSGNVSVLRTGKEAYRSARAIVTAMQCGLETVGLPAGLINLVSDPTRQSAAELMSAVGFVDLLIPRGGAGLIRACVENAKVPCIQTGTGICHLYVDQDADLSMALSILENAKTSRPSVCNAAEVCLVHQAVAEQFLPMVQDCLVQGHDPAVELRLDPRAGKIIRGTPAAPQDFDTEFLDYILAVKVVDSVEEAIEHINAHSTGHSEAIITRNEENAAQFTSSVDSAAVYVNASTRFTDGGEFGLGCEIGISTQKLHARGPMGLEALNTYRYIIHGNGQIR